jgi:hypothetical protein
MRPVLFPELWAKADPKVRVEARNNAETRNKTPCTAFTIKIVTCLGKIFTLSYKSPVK